MYFPLTFSPIKYLHKNKIINRSKHFLYSAIIIKYAQTHKIRRSKLTNKAHEIIYLIHYTQRNTINVNRPSIKYGSADIYLVSLNK